MKLEDLGNIYVVCAINEDKTLIRCEIYKGYFTNNKICTIWFPYSSRNCLGIPSILIRARLKQIGYTFSHYVINLGGKY